MHILGMEVKSHRKRQFAFNCLCESCVS
ncbi:hypothetical protein CUJ84_Chr004277 [Rhizobium leguminosarum]|uniref:Uncharacterized protein n=1 Tax=Rhizobium leguminosarum TaxID=384 RepID=A0A2K9Z8R8_RHILE|nr:hypothetical protein CUJ84_Chr004277 [Rhizobium leguminosarum]